jgi:mono/diheme cytochrome c family protein
MTTVMGILLLVTLTAVAVPAAADGDVEAGRKVAEQHCSRCHVVGDYNKYGGIGSTPTSSSPTTFPTTRTALRPSSRGARTRCS